MPVSIVKIDKTPVRENYEEAQAFVQAVLMVAAAMQLGHDRGRRGSRMAAGDA